MFDNVALGCINPIFYSSRFGSLLARLSRNSKILFIFAETSNVFGVELLSQMKMTKGTGRFHNGGALLFLFESVFLPLRP